MAAYYFVAATVMTLVPILIVFKTFIERIREQPENMNQIMPRFMMWVAIIEALPIMLIVLGFTALKPVSQLADLYLPGAIILLTFLFAIVFILMQSFVDIEVDTRQFRMISMALVVGIPLVSIIGLSLMLP